jgi:hypothetical protein
MFTDLFTKMHTNMVANDFSESTAFPRLLRPVSTPLALYFRPGRNDHRVLEQGLTEGQAGIRGIIFDPARAKIQEELRSEAKRRSIESVLDPRMLELTSATADLRSELKALEWAVARKLPPDELRGSAGKEIARSIAKFVVGNSFSAVLAPTRYLATAEDTWFRIDADLVCFLRDCLDEMGASETPIYYPLALPAAAFRYASRRREIIRVLRDLPIDSLWLRIHPFGTTASGPIALRNYIDASEDLHQMGIPLVAERTGTVGIALLAFGAVGGIECGITTGESFDYGRLRRPPKKGRPFLPHPRVYLKDLGAFMPVTAARVFFDLRNTKSFYGCRAACCPRGPQDMLTNPRKHFIATRSEEVRRLSSVPLPVRRQIYMEDFLRPATDLALQAVRVFPGLESQRRRLESWRGTLGAVIREKPAKSWSKAPDGRRGRTKASA